MIAGVVLVGLVLTARYTLPRGARGGYLLVAVSVLWLLVNKPMEGDALVDLGHGHGLTPADLSGLVGVGVGLRQAWPDVLRQSRRLLHRHRR